MENPPSLLDLARQVGINDRKLKQGFRQVFGTTVFGYLHDYRMEQARLLLIEQKLAIALVAHTVGYSHLSHFATAFRKKFGVNPSTYLAQAESPSGDRRSICKNIKFFRGLLRNFLN